MTVEPALESDYAGASPLARFAAFKAAVTTNHVSFNVSTFTTALTDREGNLVRSLGVIRNLRHTMTNLFLLAFLFHGC